jgi:hypothetical protein
MGAKREVVTVTRLRPPCPPRRAADFDSTLTAADRASSWSIIEKSGMLSVAYHESARALFNKYHPIEVDPYLTRDQKLPNMLQWWEDAHKLLLNERFTRQRLRDMVSAQSDKVPHGARHCRARAALFRARRGRSSPRSPAARSGSARACQSSSRASRGTRCPC